MQIFFGKKISDYSGHILDDNFARVFINFLQAVLMGDQEGRIVV